MAGRKRGAQPAPPRKPMTEKIADILDRHQQQMLETVGILAGRIPAVPEARRVYLTLTEDLIETTAGWSSGPAKTKNILRAPGLALFADENGIIKLSVDDCRRLARLLGAITETPSDFSEVRTS